MEFLILIRHGEFDEGEEKLNASGREQIQNLAAKIKGYSPKIYSSLGPRSIESATILAKEWRSEVTSLDLFHSIENAREAFDLLKQSNENVVIVSRGEFVTPFAAYFARDLGIYTQIKPIPKGDGLLIDIKSKTRATLFV